MNMCVNPFRDLYDFSWYTYTFYIELLYIYISYEKTLKKSENWIWIKCLIAFVFSLIWQTLISQLDIFNKHRKPNDTIYFSLNHDATWFLCFTIFQIPVDFLYRNSGGSACGECYTCRVNSSVDDLVVDKNPFMMPYKCMENVRVYWYCVYDLRTCKLSNSFSMWQFKTWFCMIKFRGSSIWKSSPSFTYTDE